MEYYIIYNKHKMNTIYIMHLMVYLKIFFSRRAKYFSIIYCNYRILSFCILISFVNEYILFLNPIP